MRNILLGNSIVRGMESTCWETIVLPGLGWQGIASWIIDHVPRLQNSVVYIHVGPLSFSRRQFSNSMRQYVLDPAPHDVREIFSVCLNAISPHSIYLVFCTAHPMSFVDYNASLTMGRLSLRRRSEYRAYDRDVIPLVVEANQFITAFNRDQDMATPFLHRQILTRRRGRYSFRHQFLSDGLHPTRATTREWVAILQRIVRMNNSAAARRQQQVHVRF